MTTQTAYKSDKARDNALASYEEILTQWPVSYKNRLVETTFGETYIIVSGDPESKPLVLLHGGGDTPQTLRYLAADLYARGFHVAVPLLPGHGRSLADFMHVTADDLSNAATSAYRELQCGHPWVGIIGLSMGGALAVQIAAASPELPALGLAAPYLAMPRSIDLAARSSWLWGWRRRLGSRPGRARAKPGLWRVQCCRSPRAPSHSAPGGGGTSSRDCADARGAIARGQSHQRGRGGASLCTPWRLGKTARLGDRRRAHHHGRQRA